MAGEMFSYEKAEQLLEPDRQDIVSAEQVIKLLDLRNDEKVIDLGAGNGYFTIPIAQVTKDRVTAVDVQLEMLEMLAQRAEDNKLDNIDRMPSGIDFLNFPDSSFQKGLAAFVFYEVDDLDKAISEIHRVIAEEGKLVVLDWEASQSANGPEMDERVPSEVVKDKLNEAGFKATVGKLNNDIYFIEAYKEKEI